jgi:mono/diheme cytochrome c family protein
MSRRFRLSLVTLGFAVAVGCQTGQHSAAGFRLPPDGDPARGKAAFVAFGCNSCHEVAGVDLPRPTVQPPVPVVLGGMTERAMTDGYLTTSIVYPSYQLAPYPKDQITANGESRMPRYADRITVRELADLVAFLQSHYTLAPVSAQPFY